MTKKPDKYDEKLKAEIAKMKADTKIKIEAIKAESKERVKRAKMEECVKSIQRLFRDGKITFKQYSSMILKLKK